MRRTLFKIAIGLMLTGILVINSTVLFSTPAPIPEETTYKMVIKVTVCTAEQWCWRRCEPCSILEGPCVCDTSLQHECMYCGFIEEPITELD